LPPLAPLAAWRSDRKLYPVARRECFKSLSEARRYLWTAVEDNAMLFTLAFSERDAPSPKARLMIRRSRFAARTAARPTSRPSVGCAIILRWPAWAAASSSRCQRAKRDESSVTSTRLGQSSWPRSTQSRASDVSSLRVLPLRSRQVRFTPESRHRDKLLACPLCAIRRH
jgi:hypothetical protein